MMHCPTDRKQRPACLPDMEDNASFLCGIAPQSPFLAPMEQHREGKEYGTERALLEQFDLNCEGSETVVLPLEG